MAVGQTESFVCVTARLRTPVYIRKVAHTLVKHARAYVCVCVRIRACTCTRPHAEGTGMVVENADADMRGQSLEAAERGWSAHTYANRIRRCTGF